MAAALTRWSAIEQTTLAAHDFRHDLVTRFWSDVYRGAALSDSTPC